MEKEKPEVEIIIKRHQQLFELLQNPQMMWRVLLSLFLIIIVIFLGLTIIVLTIKRYYPYHEIETTIQGASIVKSEDKEVIYWLFNTADLWANSGIEVHEGDELTIKASGASYTAIHHLVNATDFNYMPQDKWVGTEGQPKFTQRDLLRAGFRINKNYDEGILLMKVLPKENANDDEQWITNAPDSILTGGYIEVIGKERKSLKISKNGILHFAVNDIVLTNEIIDSMYSQWIDMLPDSIEHEKGKRIRMLKGQLKQAFKNGKVDSIMGLVNRDKLLSASEKIIEKGLGIGHYPIIDNDSSFYKAYPVINELVYYKQHKFRDAWYVDNLGSFLIIIERKK